MQPLWKKTVSTIIIIIFLLGKSFAFVCAVYSLLVCKLRLCCSSDLPWHVKIATPTVLSANALRPGIFWSTSQIWPWALSCIQRNWLPTPMHVSLLVCTRRKADFPPQQTCATNGAFPPEGAVWFGSQRYGTDRVCKFKHCEATQAMTILESGKSCNDNATSRNKREEPG